MASYPASLWDKNVQDTSADGPADPTIAQAADYNEMADEVEAIESDLRAAAAAVPGPTSSADVETAVKVLRASWGELRRASSAFSVPIDSGAFSQLTGLSTADVKGGNFVTDSTDDLTIGTDGDGKYWVEAIVEFTAPAATWKLSLDIFKGGVTTNIVGSVTGSVSGDVYQVRAAGYVDLVSTDVIDLRLGGTSAQSTTLEAVFRAQRVE